MPFPQSVKEDPGPLAWRVLALIFALIGVVTAFVPFALHTSALNAVMLNVPGDQGNWWHFLIGAPVFFAFPMLWLRLRALFASQQSTTRERNLFWAAAILSVCGTFLVEIPFLIGRAGTSQAQRWSVVLLGYGMPILSGLAFSRRKHDIPPTRACLAALNTAYLANASLCLLVYGQVAGTLSSKPGWLLMLIIVWPMLFETLSILTRLQSPPTVA